MEVDTILMAVKFLLTINLKVYNLSSKGRKLREMKTKHKYLQYQLLVVTENIQFN